MSVTFYLLAQDRKTIISDLRTVTIDGEEYEQDLLQINMHNAGAAEVAAVLGISLDFSTGGEIDDLAAFHRNCQFILSILKDEPALDACDERGHAGSGNSAFCAVLESIGVQVVSAPRPEGYLTRNITALRGITEEALLRSARLVYA